MGKFEEDAAKKGLVARDVKNAMIANVWIFAWAVSLMAISYFSTTEWYDSMFIIAAGLIVHLGIGLGMVLAFKRFLSQADELERKIQLDALALSVAVTIITFSTSSLLQKSSSLPELSPSYLIVAMSVAYCLGIIIGRKRFK